MRYERRIRMLARRAGRCHIHTTHRLWCFTCEGHRAEPAWSGTNEELEELCAFIDRAVPYYAHIPTAGVCPLSGCGGALYCEPCYNAASARVRLPDDLYTPEERTRYAALMRYVDCKEIRIGSHGYKPRHNFVSVSGE
jgi:hypothetical protein